MNLTLVRIIINTIIIIIIIIWFEKWFAYGKNFEMWQKFSDWPEVTPCSWQDIKIQLLMCCVIRDHRRSGRGAPLSKPFLAVVNNWVREAVDQNLNRDLQTTFRKFCQSVWLIVCVCVCVCVCVYWRSTFAFFIFISLSMSLAWPECSQHWFSISDEQALFKSG